ncbi:MAG: nucleotidyltransferase family protein [Paenibacillaceae bacterium]|nr:nucleotidyltransferase family protein [Paenibacillaceae bacterium]
MNHWRKIALAPSATILQALDVIDTGALQIALVVGSDDVLLGVVTDGDIRRGILRGLPLDADVSKVMNANPITAYETQSRETIIAIMKNRKRRHLPIVDDNGRVVRLELLDRLQQLVRKPNWVVLMAGGLGTRLSPLTDDCPKPLLKVGSKPILETILENFIENGFYRFYLSVNYRAEMIKDYFGDGSRWGVQIRYIHENQRLGTAGALRLIEEPLQEPILVMNGDLLTKVNFEQLLEFHLETGSDATMCVREFEFQIPYGVVKAEDHRLMRIEEKPIQRYFINGGIYVLDPELLPLVPMDTFFDMPSLFDKAIALQKNSSVYPIREYWLDIGRMDDFQRANIDVKEGLL